MTTDQPNNSTEGMQGLNTLRLTPEGEAAAASIENCGTTPQPTGPSKLTRKQIGQLKRQYYTTVHGTVRACGHLAKFSQSKPPSNNCVECWTAFFSTCVDLLGVHKLLAEKGVKGLERVYGTKYMHNFHGFLALYLREQKQAEDHQEEKENNG